MNGITTLDTMLSQGIIGKEDHARMSGMVMEGATATQAAMNDGQLARQRSAE